MIKVMVTGASSGIGKAIYEGYTKLGGYVAYGASKGGPGIFVDFKKDFWVERFKTVTDIDILINCAGYLRLDEGLSDLLDLWRVNFIAPYTLTLLYMKRGLIVINIASVSGIIESSDIPIYGATKAALISLSASMAKKYAKIDVRINCISPGYFDTNLVPEPTPQFLLDTIPLGNKEGQPEEIFDVVRFIEKAESLTGSNIVIDRGLTCKI